VKSIFLAIVLTACAQGPSKIESSAVEVFKEKSKIVTEIIQAQKGGSDFYGPNFGEEVSNPKSRNPVIGLVLLPALNLSYRYIGLLKLIKEHKVNVNIIMSAGLPTIFGSIYAQNKSISKLEWIVFKRHQSKGREVPFSKNWLGKWRKVLAAELSDKKIERSEIPLVFPFHSPENNSVHIAKKGNLLKLNMKQIDLLAANTASGVYANINYYEILKTYGVDIIIIADALGNAVRFSGKNKKLNSVYLEQIKNKINNHNELATYFNLTKDLDVADKLDSPSRLIKEGYLIGQKFITELIKRIDSWKSPKI
jgi:hypothetical protein